jgi:general secretion pathway protein G
MMYLFRKSARRGRGCREGFTLLELIVVITIIGILGTMVVVKVGGWTAKAKETRIKTDLKSIVHAADLFQAATGRYPESLEELKSGKTDAASGDGDSGLSLQNTKDPFNNEYIYEIGSDGKPHARCYGKDASPGGEGDNKDYEEPEGGEGL